MKSNNLPAPDDRLHEKPTRYKTTVRAVRIRPPCAPAAALRCAGAARRRTVAAERARQSAARSAGAQRARSRAPLREPLAAQHERRHALLSARFVHDEVQSEAERTHCADAGLFRPAS